MILLLACASIGDVEGTTSQDIHTVVRVTWTTDRPARGQVRYLGRETPLTQEGTEHEAFLLAPADTTFAYTVVVDDEESEHEATTGALPLDLPVLQVSGASHSALMAVPVIGAVTGPLVLDGEGHIVWYHLDDRGLDVYRARLARDGRSLLYNAASVSGDPEEDSELVRVALDGSSVESTPVPLLAHDFVELEEGTLTAMVVEYREHEGEDLRGDSLVEVAPDGSQTTVWSAWDCWAVEDTLDDADFGWTFANALDVDGDGYLLSLRNFSSIARIDPATGTCDWVFGRTGATFEPSSGSASFLHQHQFERFDDRLLVFDNEGEAGSRSRAIEYRFDPDEELAEQVWTYSPTPSLYSFVLGDVARMDDGDTLITWSAAGRIDRVSPEGESTWTLETPAGVVLGFNTVSE